MKRNFGLPPQIEPPELGFGSFYLIFVLALIVLWLAFIHP